MESFFAFFLLSFMNFASSANSHPMESLKAMTPTVPRGKECRTREGQIGICMDMATCMKFLLEGDLHPGNCNDEDARGKSFVCCSVSSEKVSGSNKEKREAPPYPPDTPDLRVKGCGVRVSLSDLVVGGRLADFWPWIASIFVTAGGENNSRFTCGGVVISKRFVLTAAHCFVRSGRITPASSVTVRVGSPKNSEGTAFPVSNVIVHENYSSHLHYDDIALLRTSKDIEVKNVVPVCLPSPGMYNSNFYQREATVLGWGNVRYGGSSSDVLMEATVPVVPNNRCDTRYRRLSPLSLPRGIIETQMCAGADDGSRDACQGDSGGPLLLEDRSGKWNVIGVVSLGYRCGESEFPGVYTRVAKYLKWLQKHADITPPSST